MSVFTLIGNTLQRFLVCCFLAQWIVYAVCIQYVEQTIYSGRLALEIPAGAGLTQMSDMYPPSRGVHFKTLGKSSQSKERYKDYCLAYFLKLTKKNQSNADQNDGRSGLPGEGIASITANGNI
jgi:hypothetical protein